MDDADVSDVESVSSSLSETGSVEASSSTKVYIGSRLPRYVTKQDITNHFLKYGFDDCVTGVNLVYKGSRFMGWGCVYMRTAEDAQKAISVVNGTNLLVREKYRHTLVVQRYIHKTRSASSQSPSTTTSTSKRTPSHTSRSRRRQSSSGSSQGEQTCCVEVSVEKKVAPMGKSKSESGGSKKTHQEHNMLDTQCYVHKTQSTSSQSPVVTTSTSKRLSSHTCGSRRRQSSSGGSQGEQIPCVGVSTEEKVVSAGKSKSLSSRGSKKTHQERKRNSSKSTLRHVVQLNNCHIHISEEDICAIARVPVISCVSEPVESCSSVVRTIHITVNTLKDASEVIAATNDKSFFGYTISAAIVPTTTSVDEPSQGNAKATILYFSTCGVISKLGFEKYLSHQLPKYVGKFEITGEARQKNYSQFQVQFSSTNTAKRALKTLKKVAGDYTVSMDGFDNKPLIDEIANFQASVNDKKSRCISQHHLKLNKFQVQLKEVQIPKKCPVELFNKLIVLRAAREQQVTECKQQESEFMYYCDLLQPELEHLKSLVLSHSITVQDTLSKMRKDFGKECSRFLKALPIYAKRRAIVNAILSNQVVIIIGQTGSGKSTQIVQYLYNAGLSDRGIIVCTQPRKVAAVSLAKHVSTEMNVQLGTTLGYKMGSFGKHSPETKVMYMTDHALLNECISDRDFTNYSCLVIDEAHERSIHTDLLLAFIKQVLPRRPDLKVVITSATIDPRLFNTYFGGQCPILEVPGRTFPVEVVWKAHLTAEEASLTRNSLELGSNEYIANAMKVVKDIHDTQEPGDVLVFLPAPMEIERACESVRKNLSPANSIVLPLHGKLQPEDQQKVFHKYDGKRKIVLCTNIAETSVTIPGVKYIVDTGLAKELCFDSKRNMNSLEVRVISQSSAEQRKGRAGRTSAGKCYRLYSEEEYQAMQPQMLPEILRVHLAHACLKLYEFGISDILSFDFVEHPDPVALKAAVETLIFLGAVSEEKLTDVGKSMAALPLDPHLAKILLDGIAAGVGPEATAVVAISSLAGSVFFRGGTNEMKSMSDRSKIQFCHSAGDQVSYLSVYHEWMQQKRDRRTQWCVNNYINAKSMRLVEETIKELRDILTKKLSIELVSRALSVEKAADTLPKLFFDSYIHNLSVFLGHERVGFLTERMPDESLVVFPGSSLHQLNLVSQLQCVVFEKTLKTSQNFLLQVIPVKEEWIQEAIQAGKLPSHPVDKFRDSFVTPTTITNIGQQVFGNVVNRKTLPDIMKELDGVCEGTHNTIELEDREKGMLHIYCQPQYHEKVKFQIKKRLDSERMALKRVRFEEGVTSQEDNVRVVLGLGGCVEHVLMPYQHRGVVVKGPDNTEWTNTVLESLLQFGDIERHTTKVFGKPRECRLFVTFYDPGVAQQAVAAFETPEGVTIQPLLPVGRGEMDQRFRLNLEWCRRKRMNYALLKFLNEEDFEIAKGMLVDRELYVSGCWVDICPPNNDKLQLFVGNVNFQIKEEDLKAAIDPYLIGIQVTVYLGYEKPFETTEEQLDTIRTQLVGLIERSATRGHYQLSLSKPESYYRTFRANVTFDDPNEGEKTLNDLNLQLQSIGDKLLTVKPDLVSSNRYTPPIYSVIRDSVVALKSDLQDYFGNKVKLNDERKDKWGNVIVQVTSDDIEAFATAKRILNAAVNPVVIEHPFLRQFVLSRMCQSKLAEIQSNTSTYILVDRRIMSLCIYGTEANRSRAKISLNDTLDMLAHGNAVLKEFNLKAVGQPPGIMKHLVSRFGLDLQGMVKEGSVSAVELDARRHILSVYGTQDAHKEISEIIEEYCSSVSVRQRPASVDQGEMKCCACFLPIETPSEVFRLEYCGHAYCLVCVSVQVSRDALVFPVQCAADGCAHPFIWQDFLNLFKSTKFKLQELKSESLRAYLKANKDKVRNCPTFDCEMVYAITEDGKRFICSHCGVQTCTKCHEQYHDGLSCEMYHAERHGEKEFEEWLRQNLTERKRCPNPSCEAPIEKVSGCNNVYCTQCKANICWVCLEYFDTSQLCYAHLYKVHGGFI